MKVDLDRVPSTFAAAVEMLAGTADARDVAAVNARATARDASVAVHHSVGQWLRNYWGLWDAERTPLRLDVERLTGLSHPDDVTGLILHAVCCRLRGDAFDLKAAAAGYLEHWRRQNCNPDGSPRG